jgi:hypothetical protein
MVNNEGFRRTRQPTTWRNFGERDVVLATLSRISVEYSHSNSF